MIDDAMFLTQAPAFESLSHRDAQRLLEQAERASYREGETIIRKGEMGDRMYVIVHGRVRIPVLDEAGQQRMTAHLNQGEIFGEMALLTDMPRTADVVADTDPTECLVLERNAVQRLMREHPKVARFLTEILGKRLLEGDKMRQVGKYRLLGRLGAGGMATVYEGFHPTLNRRVAIKMLPHQLVYEGDFLERFRREARTIADMHHPNIVQVYDTEEAYATYFIVMELLSGRDLGDVLKEQGPLPFDQARGIIRQMAAALHYAHSHGVVHADVKPSNIFLEEGRVAKLVDFGIARRARADAERRKEGEDDEEFVGTPVYAAPEAFSGKGIDARSDIYSLGITAFHMLTGTLPFPGPTPMQIMMQHMMEPLPDITKRRPGIPDDLVAFVVQSTKKKPEERLPNCAAVLSLLSPPVAAPGEASLVGEVLTVFFAPGSRPEVEAILRETKDKLLRVGGARVARAELPQAGRD